MSYNEIIAIPAKIIKIASIFFIESFSLKYRTPKIVATTGIDVLIIATKETEEAWIPRLKKIVPIAAVADTRNIVGRILFGILKSFFIDRCIPE